jgi:hypothetical protein
MIPTESRTIGKYARMTQTTERDTVTVRRSTTVLENNDGNSGMLCKILCYRKAETLADAEDAVRWWRNNLV